MPRFRSDHLRLPRLVYGGAAGHAADGDRLDGGTGGGRHKKAVLVLLLNVFFLLHVARDYFVGSAKDIEGFLKSPLMKMCTFFLPPL